ncbi:hypothetical protein L596_029164 [Steinernema carpocapsae]|uniref:Uncharacterized protein n=1 Tax=Steinernema carpocapsae TaxID=34508 RepID=A0A4U5LTU3_STECR|nr:hypothetical protein L596_029164 [Steinernema carpocapsae]
MVLQEKLPHSHIYTYESVVTADTRDTHLCVTDTIYVTWMSDPKHSFACTPHHKISDFVFLSCYVLSALVFVSVNISVSSKHPSAGMSYELRTP